jgi:hypothetical protein
MLESGRWRSRSELALGPADPTSASQHDAKILIKSVG